MFWYIFEKAAFFLLLIFNHKYSSYAWSTITPRKIRRPLVCMIFIYQVIWNRKMKRHFILYICSLKLMNQQKTKKLLSSVESFQLKGLNLSFLRSSFAPIFLCNKRSIELNGILVHQIEATYAQRKTPFHFSVSDYLGGKYHAQPRTTSFTRREA